MCLCLCGFVYNGINIHSVCVCICVLLYSSLWVLQCWHTPLRLVTGVGMHLLLYFESLIVGPSPKLRSVCWNWTHLSYALMSMGDLCENVLCLDLRLGFGPKRLKISVTCKSLAWFATVVVYIPCTWTNTTVEQFCLQGLGTLSGQNKHSGSIWLLCIPHVGATYWFPHIL